MARVQLNMHVCVNAQSHQCTSTPTTRVLATVLIWDGTDLALALYGDGRVTDTVLQWTELARTVRDAVSRDIPLLQVRVSGGSASTQHQRSGGEWSW
jgi:hypothetical protein